jgi:hypothetical protein
MQAQLDAFRDFDFANSTVNLWVYKNTTSAEKYLTWYVQTDNVLNGYLRNIAVTSLNATSEIYQYGHLAQVTEISFLSIKAVETDFHFLKDQVDRFEADYPIRGVSDLKGAAGYVVKFSHLGKTVYAIRRSAANWKTTYPKKFINVIFRDGELTATENNSFSIEKNFDFFVFENLAYIKNKAAFETVLKFREGYANSFSNLQADASFAPLFSNIQPLVDFVGTNAMHLRRMSAVVQKNIYSHPNFLPNLQQFNNLRNLGLNFDPASGQILVCDRTAKVVMDVLLDHYLMSEVTANFYLVPDATRI